MNRGGPASHGSGAKTQTLAHMLEECVKYDVGDNGIRIRTIDTGGIDDVVS